VAIVDYSFKFRNLDDDIVSSAYASKLETMILFDGRFSGSRETAIMVRHNSPAYPPRLPRRAPATLAF
jgi:hypothetical protein